MCKIVSLTWKSRRKEYHQEHPLIDALLSRPRFSIATLHQARSGLCVPVLGKVHFFPSELSLEGTIDESTIIRR